MKAFFNEFKKFISRGNVMDMAVGIIIGGAFTSIVNSLVNDVIMPLVGIITGGIDFAGLSVTVGGAELLYGSFIAAVINFLLVAFVLFSVIKAMNTAKEKMTKKTEEAPKAPAKKICPFCKSEVDIKATRCAFCTSELTIEE